MQRLNLARDRKQRETVGSSPLSCFSARTHRGLRRPRARSQCGSARTSGRRLGGPPRAWASSRPQGYPLRCACRFPGGAPGSRSGAGSGQSRKASGADTQSMEQERRAVVGRDALRNLFGFESQLERLWALRVQLVEGSSDAQNHRLGGGLPRPPRRLLGRRGGRGRHRSGGGGRLGRRSWSSKVLPLGGPLVFWRGGSRALRPGPRRHLREQGSRSQSGIRAQLCVSLHQSGSFPLSFSAPILGTTQSTCRRAREMRSRSLWCLSPRRQ